MEHTRAQRRRLGSDVRIIASVVALVWAMPVAADVLTPTQAVAHALENNPELLAAREQSLAARARGHIANSARLPQINARYTARESNNPLDAFADKLNTRSVTAADFNPDTLNDPAASRVQIAELSLQVPVYTGGRIFAGIRAAEQDSAAAGMQYERVKETIAAQTLQAYLAAQTAARAHALAADAVHAAQRHADTTASLHRQGRIVSSDKLTAAVNLAAMQGLREQAATRERHARNQLRRLMGVTLDTELELAPMDADTADSSAIEPAALEQRALSLRKDLAAQTARVAARYAQADALRAARGVEVNFIANTGWYDRQFADDNNSWSVMGVISKSLYSGGRLRDETVAARHDANGAQAQLRSLEQGVRQEVRAAYDNLNEARTRLSIAQDNVAAARQTVALVNKRYGEGRTILIDLLQAERALIEARNEELDALHRLAHNRIALRAAVGEM